MINKSLSQEKMYQCINLSKSPDVIRLDVLNPGNFLIFWQRNFIPPQLSLIISFLLRDLRYPPVLQYSWLEIPPWIDGCFCWKNQSSHQTAGIQVLRRHSSLPDTLQWPGDSLRGKSYQPVMCGL